MSRLVTAPDNDSAKQNPIEELLSNEECSTDGRLLETQAESMQNVGCIPPEKPFDLEQYLAIIGQADRPHGFNWLVEPPAWLNS
jgi:hypothetical protein